MKITFMGAGSTVFVKNVLGDTLLAEALCDCEIALYDIDGKRLDESYLVVEALNKKYNANKAVVRNAASDNKDDWNGLETEWSSGAPSEILTREQHTSRYGLWATEFSDYVVTEKTLLTADAMPQKDADGYVLRVSLSVAADSETGMQDATQYYKRQMRTMGDLDDYPEFSSAELTFYFSEDWTLNKLETDEVYKSKKG